MIKVTVLANCHCLPVAKILATGTRGCAIEFVDVNLLSQSPFRERAERLPHDHESLVFSVPLADTWGDLASSRLRPRFGARYRTFTNIHFDGLHPDITYLGRMGSRVAGALSDYHSRLILYGFATGRSATDAKALFDARTVEAVGYHGAFAAAADELVRREAGCDVRFAAAFLDLCRTRPSLYTVNHPTDAVFADLCAALAGSVGLPFERPDPHLLTNPLADSVVWPVLDEIAAAHALPYRTAQRYYAPNAFLSRGFDRGEIVDAFYAAYAAVPREDLLADLTGHPFWPVFQAALG